MKAPDSVFVGRAPAALSLAAATAFAIVLFLGFDPAFHDRLLAWNNGGWSDAAFDGVYPAARSFRALLEIFASLAVAWPVSRLFVRKGAASARAAEKALFLCAVLLGVLLRFDLWWTKSFWIDAYSLPLAAAVVLAAVPVGVSRLLTDRIYSWSMPDAVSELDRRAAGGGPVLLGGYHHVVACAYVPDWIAANESRVEVFVPDAPDAFAARLDGLAASPETAFWTLWAPRSREGRVLPGLFSSRLSGRRADFVKKTPAGILQHFPGTETPGTGATP